MCRPDRPEGDVGIGVTHLGHGGMGRTVGRDESVAAEVAVARLTVAVVAAVSPVGSPRCIVTFESLIDPVPNEAALQIGIFVDRLPLQPQRAVGVAHRVRIFAWHDGTVGAFAAPRFEHPRRGVHRHEHIGVPLPLRTFVADRAVHAALALLAGFEPLVGLVEVVAVARFVGRREDRDRGIVVRTLVHIAQAYLVRRPPRAVVAQRAARVEAVTHAVGLDIGLRVDVEAQRVAQFVEAALLRIVAGADGVDVVRLHQQHILEQQLFGNIVPRAGIVFVKVDPLELNGLSVDEQHAVGAVLGVALGSVGELKAAESHVEGDVNRPFGGLDVHYERIEVGRLGRPVCRVGQLGVKQGFARRLLPPRGNGTSLAVEQFVTGFDRFVA